MTSKNINIMKEKILGALLALSPFKGNAQEGKVENQDKVISPTEQVPGELPAEKKVIDSKTANPWKVNLETNLSLVNQSAIGRGHQELFGTETEIDQKSLELIQTSQNMLESYVNGNFLLKSIDAIEETGGLGSYASTWDAYKKGQIDFASAYKSLQLSQAYHLPIAGNNLVPSNLSEYGFSMLLNYFSEQSVLKGFKTNGNEFSAGSSFMGDLLSSTNKDNLSIQNLIEQVKNGSTDMTYEAKIGALSLLSLVLNRNNNSEEQTKTENDATAAVLNDVLANAILSFQGEVTGPKQMGECRHLAALVSELAAKGFNLDATEVSATRHVLVQIKNEQGITLLDGGHLINSVSGRPILSKDDVDAAIVKNFCKPTISDLTVEAGGNKVLYENRYNNFAGLMKKLTNRDNLSLRAPEFIAGDNKLDLFPRLSEAGVTRGSIEKGNVGLQAYWLRSDNEYNSFMKDIKGLNLAGYVPAEFSLAKKGFKNIFFANLGFYHSVLELTADNGGETRTWDATVSFEDYLRCSLNTSLTAGLVTKLGDFNQELSRTGQVLKPIKSEYSGSVAPFVSFEIPGSKDKNERTYLCSGLEATEYMASPDIRKISAFPWFQAGLEYNKNAIDFGLRLRGEFQPASARFDFDSFLKKETNQFELRAFLELYNQEFKKLTPYKDVAGIEAGIRHDVGNGHNLFLMLSAKSDGGEVRQVVVNVGINF